MHFIRTNNNNTIVMSLYFDYINIQSLLPQFTNIKPNNKQHHKRTFKFKLLYYIKHTFIILVIIIFIIKYFSLIKERFTLRNSISSYKESIHSNQQEIALKEKQIQTLEYERINLETEINIEKDKAQTIRNKIDDSLTELTYLKDKETSLLNKQQLLQTTKTNLISSISKLKKEYERVFYSRT